MLSDVLCSVINLCLHLNIACVINIRDKRTFPSRDERMNISQHKYPDCQIPVRTFWFYLDCSRVYVHASCTTYRDNGIIASRCNGNDITICFLFVNLMCLPIDVKWLRDSQFLFVGAGLQKIQYAKRTRGREWGEMSVESCNREKK